MLDTLYFACTADSNINLGRVRNRAELGGHDVPPDRIVARYNRTLELLPDAIRNAGRVVLFDNTNPYKSSSDSLQPVAEIRQPSDGKFIVTLRGEVPAWSKPALAMFQPRIRQPD